MGDKVNSFNGSVWQQKEIGVANGLAGLDGTGKVPTAQLPTSSGGASGDSGSAVAAFQSGKTQFPKLLSSLTSKSGLLGGRIVEYGGFLFVGFRGGMGNTAQAGIFYPESQTYADLYDSTSSGAVTDVAVASYLGDNRRFILFLAHDSGVDRVDYSTTFTGYPGVPPTLTLNSSDEQGEPASGRCAIIQSAGGHVAWFTYPGDTSKLYYWPSTGSNGTVVHAFGSTTTGPIASIPGGILLVATAAGVKKAVTGGTMLSSLGSFSSHTSVYDIAWDGARVLIVRSGELLALSLTGEVLWTVSDTQFTTKSRIQCTGKGYFIVSGTSEPTLGTYAVAWYVESQTGKYLGTSEIDGVAQAATHAIVACDAAGHVASITQQPTANPTTESFTNLVSLSPALVLGMELDSGDKQFQTATFTLTSSAASDHTGPTAAPGDTGQNGYIRRVFFQINVNTPTIGGTSFELTLKVNGTPVTSPIPFTESGTGTFYINDSTSYAIPISEGDVVSVHVEKNPAASDSMDWLVNWGITYSTTFPATLPGTFTLPYNSTPFTPVNAVEIDDVQWKVTVNNDLGFGADTYEFQVLTGIDLNVVQTTTGTGFTTGVTNFLVELGPGLEQWLAGGDQIVLRIINQSNPGNIPDWTVTANFSVFGTKLTGPNHLADSTGTLTVFTGYQLTMVDNLHSGSWTWKSYVNGSLVGTQDFTEQAAPNGGGTDIPIASGGVVAGSTILRTDLVRLASGAGGWNLAWDDRTNNTGFYASVDVAAPSVYFALSGPTENLHADRRLMDIERLRINSISDVGTLATDTSGIVYLKPNRITMGASANVTVDPSLIRTVYVDSSQPSFTVTFSGSLSDGVRMTVKDIGNNAGANNITIVATGYTIDGNADYVLSINQGAVEFEFSGGYNWQVVGVYP